MCENEYCVFISALFSFKLQNEILHMYFTSNRIKFSTCQMLVGFSINQVQRLLKKFIFLVLFSYKMLVIRAGVHKNNKQGRP